VAETPWATGYEATGTVRARTSANISAKVMGYVRQVAVRAGDRVTAGQTLVTIDARDLESEYRRAEAGLEEARAAVPEVDNAAAAAKAQLDLASTTFRRIEDLYKKKSVSHQEFDEASARLKAAQASHEMTLAKRQQVQAKIAQAERAQDSARIMVGYAQLTAPFAGVVTAKTVEEGTLATPGAPLLTIEREGEYRLEAAVEESRVNSIRSGQAATVTIEALGRPVSGRISEIVPAVDPGSRAYTVKIDLPAASALRSGMFGRAVFSQGTRRVLAVAEAAVAERGQLVSVMVVEGGAARTRLITVGERRGGSVEVLSGLTAGETVISPLPAALADGARVEVRQ
jgi:RND family efflux transporter MFP subunit